jgi:large subunit ribosomal protein L29
MKIKEIREKETQAIQAELKDLQKHLFDLRTQAVTEKLENPSLLRKTRRDIARMKTILQQREPAKADSTSNKSEKQ